MKWIRVFAITLVAGGIILQQYLTRPELRQSVGIERKSESENVVQQRKDLLLPDLKLLPTKTVYIESGRDFKKLRFDTHFVNIGIGPLELRGEADEEREITVATQVIKKADGGNEERVIGEFVFHPGHDHWHVDKYAQFEIWSIDGDGEPEKLLLSTDKYSFCIWDEEPYDLKLENAPQSRQYPRCPQDIQGNSVGWGDNYAPHLEGQEVDIMGLENGTYAIISRVNAERSIIEENYENNSVRSYISVNGFNVRILETFE
jgi:hypothetical protein